MRGCLEQIMIDGEVIQFVPDDILDRKMLDAAINQSSYAIRYIKGRVPDDVYNSLCESALKGTLEPERIESFVSNEVLKKFKLKSH